MVVFACLATLMVRPAFGQVQVEGAFPDLWFDRPVDLQHAGDGTNRLFVLEQHEARIMVFPNEPGAASADVFLDLYDRVRTDGGEEGLLGLVFHPNYASNGTFMCITQPLHPADLL